MLTTTQNGDPGTDKQCVIISSESGAAIDASSYQYLTFSVKDMVNPKSATVKVTFVDEVRGAMKRRSMTTGPEFGFPLLAIRALTEPELQKSSSASTGRATTRLMILHLLVDIAMVFRR